MAFFDIHPPHLPCLDLQLSPLLQHIDEEGHLVWLHIFIGTQGESVSQQDALPRITFEVPHTHWLFSPTPWQPLDFTQEISHNELGRSGRSSFRQQDERGHIIFAADEFIIWKGHNLLLFRRGNFPVIVRGPGVIVNDYHLLSTSYIKPEVPGESPQPALQFPHSRLSPCSLRVVSFS